MSKNIADTACIRQQLFRIILASISLQSELFACLRRLDVLEVALDHEDISNVVDRLNETFNAYAQLTRCNGWHDLDDDSEDEA